MRMIIGGAYQGQLEFAMKLTGYGKEEFADGASCGFDTVYTAKGIYDFQEYIRRCLADGRDCAALADGIMERNPGLTVVSNELGYGIVPCDPFDRLWRETTGRVCTRLAGASEQVYRVVCGIGMKIKDEG